MYQTIKQIGIQDDNELSSRIATGNNREKRRAISSVKKPSTGQEEDEQSKAETHPWSWSR